MDEYINSDDIFIIHPGNDKPIKVTLEGSDITKTYIIKKNIYKKGRMKMFQVEVDMRDLEEIESRYDELAKWCTTKFSSFAACALVLQTVMDKVDECKAALTNKE